MPEVSLESPWSEVTSIHMERNHPLLDGEHLEVAGTTLVPTEDQEQLMSHQKE